MTNQIDFGTPILRSLPTRTGRGRNVLHRGFTVLELVGVLAIIAILAAAILPNVIRRIDRATLDREKSDLKVMANGLVRTILTDKQIPAANGVPQAIAKYLDLSLNQVTNTPRRLGRVFLIDPNSRVNGTNLPYNQALTTNGASSLPVSNRVLIVSAIAGPAVSTITDTFSTIWDTADGSKPASWGGKAEDLCIQRVDLGPLFHKVFLQFIDANSSHLGYYNVETNSPPSPVSSTAPTITFYVLDGTTLNLFEFSDPNNLQYRVIIRKDEGFSYQNDRWSQRLSLDQPDFNLVPQSFAWWVNEFLKPDAPPGPSGGGAKFKASQQAVIDEFYNYLWSYWAWATAGYNTGIGTPTQYPAWETIDGANTRLGDVTGNLIN